MEPAGTRVEEAQFGEHLVYAAHTDGSPFHTLIAGEVTLDIGRPEGSGSYPVEAAVQTLFEALTNLSEVE